MVQVVVLSHGGRRRYVIYCLLQSIIAEGSQHLRGENLSVYLKKEVLEEDVTSVTK